MWLGLYSLGMLVDPKLEEQRVRFINLLSLFIVLIPIFIYPAYLVEGVGKPVFIPNAEAVHLIPRLILIGVVTILGWRFWGTRGLFSGLLIGFAITVVLSSLSANDPAGWVFTIFGPKARMDGLIYQFLLVALGIAAYGALRQAPHLLPRILWALLASGVLQSLLVLLQSFGIDLVGPSIGGSAFEENMGSMGHIGVAAGFLLVAAVASLSLLSIARTNRTLFVLAVFGILFVSLGLGITQNRTAAFALVGAVVLFTLIGFSWQRLLIGVGMLLSTFAIPQALPDKHAVERGYGNTATLESRFVIWQLAYESLRFIPGAPLIGGGPDAFLLTLTRHFSTERLLDFYRVEHQWPPDAQILRVESFDPPDMGRDRLLRVYFSQYGGQQNVQGAYLVRLDKVHNMFFDRLVAFGIFASLIWLILLVYPVYLTWKQRRLQATTLWLILPAIGIYYLAWFPVLQLEPIFMILIAAVWSLTDLQTAPSSNQVQ
jgi:O-antigen ligase